MSSREIMNAQGFGSKKYSLDCSYYDKEFDSIDELIDDIARVEWTLIMKLLKIIKVQER